MGKSTEDVYRLCSCGSGKKYKFCCLLAAGGGRFKLPGTIRFVGSLLHTGGRER